MVKASREAIEDFQDFESDKAIVYAAKQISALEHRNKELEEAIGEAKLEIDRLTEENKFLQHQHENAFEQMRARDNVIQELERKIDLAMEALR